MIRKEDKDKYLTIEDINKPSVRIGVNPGGTNEEFVRQYLNKANVTVVENNLDIPHLVAEGTYDVMITDTVEAMLYAKADPRLYAAQTDKPFTNSEKGYMIPRGDFIYASYLEMWMDEMKLRGNLMPSTKSGWNREVLPFYFTTCVSPLKKFENEHNPVLN
ncbi:transporter substrate-binding domain-containing protein [Peribacillus frigoritolerans]|nr:transporter substrate-binding domain-containing protein [Peribacillus frigoritolerans]